MNLIKANEARVFAFRGILNGFWETSDSRSLHSFARDNGFTLVANPAANILSWAGSVSELLLRVGEKTIAERSSPSNLERFNPMQARFTADALGSMKVDLSRKVELFRLDDPIIPAMRVSMLGSLNEEGRASYSYIEDSSWAVWLAFTSFIDFAARKYHPALSPWPLCYRSETNSLVLPARLRLPSILERALCASAGLLPTKVKCFTSDKPLDDSFELLCKESMRKVARVPTVCITTWRTACG